MTKFTPLLFGARPDTKVAAVVPHRLMCLRALSSAGGANLEGCGTFRKWGTGNGCWSPLLFSSLFADYRYHASSCLILCDGFSPQTINHSKPLSPLSCLLPGM